MKLEGFDMKIYFYISLILYIKTITIKFCFYGFSN